MSPDGHNGNSEILVKEALSAIQEAGGECSLINLFDYHIEPCLGCEACTMSMGDVAMGKGDYKGCVLKEKDDMDKIVILCASRTLLLSAFLHMT